MKLRLARVAPINLVLLSLLAGCSDDTGAPANTGGAPVGGTSPAPAGSGGSTGSAGAKSTAGTTFGGSGGLGAGGSSAGGGSAGFMSTGGGSNAGSGGMKSTGGVSGGGSAGASTGGGASGGVSGSGGGSAIPPTFATVKAVIIESSSCFGTICHDLKENPLYLKKESGALTDDELYTKLRAHMTKNCGQLINLASPAESALVKLLKGPCGQTERMPLQMCVDDGDTACVAPDSIAAIQQWIANGAMK